MSRPKDLIFSQQGGCKKPLKSKGFTLLEVLVTMLLIGIIMSFATLSVNLGGTDTHVLDEAKRLQALIKLAQEEALLNNRVLGLALEPGGYVFYSLQQRQWEPLNDEYLSPHKWAEDVELEVNIEGMKIVLEDSTDTPQVLILPDGEMTAFSGTLRQYTQDLSYQLEASMLGELRLVTHSPED